MLSYINILDGLYYASILYLLSLGLNLVFGVSKLLNLGHGSFYSLGAYITAWFIGIALSYYRQSQALLLIPYLGIAIGAIAVAAIGALLEKTIIRFLYNITLERQLLATYGILLIFSDIERMIWGGNILSAPQPVDLLGNINVGGYYYPTYYILLIIISFSIGIGMHLFIYKTDIGILIRATSYDRELAPGLGINVRRVSTVTFLLSAFLAGLAGSLIVPITSATLGMEIEPLILAFIVSVIGGLGSFWGSLIGSILIGELRSLGIALFPEIELAIVFLIAAIVLAIRPEGLLGKRYGR
ncbi:MAG: branched-chain amino acid ABC transporter permease [Sulfolobales archaeon]